MSDEPDSLNQQYACMTCSTTFRLGKVIVSQSSETRPLGVGCPMLHILPQDGWHDPAAIVGTRNGLIAIRDAIDKALANGAATARVFPSDGEGYRVVVACRESVDDVPLGYTDEIASNHSEGWPKWLYEAAYHDVKGQKP